MGNQELVADAHALDLGPAERIIRYLAAGGAIETRLVETGRMDVEFFQRALPDDLGLCRDEHELIHLLHRLEAADTIIPYATVHPHDTSEYLVQWRLS
jgi:hypothetical protein